MSVCRASPVRSWTSHRPFRLPASALAFQTPNARRYVCRSRAYLCCGMIVSNTYCDLRPVSTVGATREGYAHGWL
eukprot:5512582-Prymnesium_polylepis.1